MIIGIGTDILDIRRVEKLLDDKFIARCFTKAEQEYCNRKRPGGGHVAAYARRFAAKEACAKALGCGIGKNAGLLDIEITHDKNGRPEIILHGAALKTAQEHAAKFNIQLSISDEPPYAQAFVVIESSP